MTGDAVFLAAATAPAVLLLPPLAVAWRRSARQGDAVLAMLADERAKRATGPDDDGPPPPDGGQPQGAPAHLAPVIPLHTRTAPVAARMRRAI
ncbi:hypothetical protein LO771_10395 [Streptacidiphilus sp. ASG 303]|uniref:hypothetical protein n=1 Tax=Streptacidiphilus sp. ASG 303 TaxID=2896847 RepID=UPI001E363622|nr:hypothetical protein [Streptacidiphilus sp. ASG 303]MCD0482796.1 hypothetical protein [Streptacidiphilus sp. ASG 303]